MTRFSPLKLSNFKANIEGDLGYWERGKEVDVDLSRSLASQVLNGKHDFCERSTSIAKWTMETFSVDAKDAGKGEREKRFSLCLSHDTYQNRSNRSRIAHESAKSGAWVRGRTSIQLTQDLMSRIVVFDLCICLCDITIILILKPRITEYPRKVLETRIWNLFSAFFKWMDVWRLFSHGCHSQEFFEIAVRDFSLTFSWQM